MCKTNIFLPPHRSHVTTYSLLTTHMIARVLYVIIKFMIRSFCDHVYKFHGLPKEILNDKDPRFTRNALHDRCGTRLAMSNAFHPQIDGQTTGKPCH